MLALERQQEIYTLMKEKKSVTVDKLARIFYSSETTIRRDLDKLETAGYIRRTYGGALLVEGVDTEIPLSVRESENIHAKNAIAMAAADMVTDNDIIIMDSSSSVLRMVPFLGKKKNLTVITNGAKAAVELGSMLHPKVYCTGGFLRENSLSYIGPHANAFMLTLHANKVFFSTRSVSLNEGVTDINEQEAELRQIMIRNSRNVVLLIDSTKIGTVSFSAVCPLSVINTMITDDNETVSNPEWMQSGVRILRV
ncbi:MAG: DeoR/GlpR family DNA-binding transcription regulator [Saccharofermentanales bacterium]